MTQIINQQEPLESNTPALDRKRISEARIAIIIAVSWVMLAPFAIWFGVSHLENFWLAIVPIVFGCVAVIPLVGSYALVTEYRAALHGKPLE